MDEEALNMSIRKFLKKVGITSQREIERALDEANRAGRLDGSPVRVKMTLECGLPGHRAGEEHVIEYVDACLHLAQVPDTPVAAHDMDLFHTVATVRVPERMSFGYSNPEVAIRLVQNLDRLNWLEV